tara:strand:+ start:85803 stop:86096 length:294 start_codon:yes stop_codon:yes gene_type:complete
MRLRTLGFGCALVALAACGTPHAEQYDFLRESLEPTRTGLTANDKVVAEADCRAAARRYGATIIFGNFGGRETRAVFLKCMGERGWRYVEPKQKAGS